MNNESIKDMGETYVMNTYGRFPAAMVRGEGSRLFDADQKDYIDFLGGIAVTLFGHSYPPLVEVLQKQAGTLLHCSNYYWIEPQNQLARLLCTHSRFDKVFFCNSGAEANEGAIKLARKYSALKYGPGRHKILSMERSFHGRTLATLTATGQDHFHQDFLPLPLGFDYIPLNDMQALREKADDSVCAVMVEAIQGEGGVYALDVEVAKEMAAFCQERDILLIADEVQTGMGRTGELFAYQGLGIEPDIMTLAKALGGGVPIGAFLATDEVAGALKPGDHGSTFGGNPLASAAGVLVMQTLLQDGFMEKMRKTAQRFQTALQSLTLSCKMALAVRGRGLMLALELDREAKPVMKRLFEAGLLCSVAGEKGLRFLPALNLTDEEMDEGMNRLKQVLDTMGEE